MNRSVMWCQKIGVIWRQEISWFMTWKQYIFTYYFLSQCAIPLKSETLIAFCKWDWKMVFFLWCSGLLWVHTTGVKSITDVLEGYDLSDQGTVPEWGEQSRSGGGDRLHQQSNDHRRNVRWQVKDHQSQATSQVHLPLLEAGPWDHISRTRCFSIVSHHLSPMQPAPLPVQPGEDSRPCGRDRRWFRGNTWTCFQAEEQMAFIV